MYNYLPDKLSSYTMASRPTAIDLFAGAGGFSTGLTWAGFDVLWAIDSVDHCRQTYERNHPDVEFVCDDIRDVKPTNLPLEENSLDLIVGGPPCPTFSKIGRGKINSIQEKNSEEQPSGDIAGATTNFEDQHTPAETENVLTDDRHYLFEEFVGYISELQPRAFLMENVAGMQSAKTRSGENVVERIKRNLRDEGYQVSTQVLDAADFGVPQHRERLFVLGNCLGKENPVMEDWATHRKPLNDKEKELKAVTRRDQAQSTLEQFGLTVNDSFRSFAADQNQKAPWITVGDAILDLPPVSPEGSTPPKKATEYTIPPVSEYQEWARDIPRETTWQEMPLYNHECRGHNLTDLTLYKLLGEGVGWVLDDIDEEFHPYRSDVFKDQYKKDNPREPASTVNAHIQKDGHMSIHPREARSFTVREAARLQSFRDTFQFPVSRSHAFKQIGNAVPPLLAEALCTSIRSDVLGS
jgi:DNA (cytosine-5)-methyltransferase 1